MARTKHGHSWIERHLSDPYVRKAKAQGYRSRASFKLLELHQKDKLFRKGMRIIDLGAAPGGWSQVVSQIVGEEGKIIALDLLPIPKIPHVTFMQGDFEDEAVYDELCGLLENKKVDWILSDMSPNLSGVIAVDQPRIMRLAERTWYFAQQHLKVGGGLLIKVFQGEDFDLYVKNLRKCFKKLSVRKPDASRLASRELYVLAQGYYNI